jgi:hypothetical protein
MARSRGLGDVYKRQALAYVVPDALVTSVRNIMKEEMNRPVDWALDLPLACDTKAGPTYGDAK